MAPVSATHRSAIDQASVDQAEVPGRFKAGRRVSLRENTSIVTAHGSRRDRQRALANGPDGTGLPVLLIPGFLSGDWRMRPMATFLRSWNFVPATSGVGFNVDCTAVLVERLEARLRELTQLHQRKVAIVGWSRGGMLGKIVALRQPELSFGLVTIVSPNLNPRAFSNRVERQLSTLLQVSQKRAISGVMKPECVYGACADRSLAELQQPLTESVPYASIYSRPDGVVNWRACLDEGARLIEVHTSHTGAGVTPRVIRLVGDELASTTARPPSGRT